MSSEVSSLGSGDFRGILNWEWVVSVGVDGVGISVVGNRGNNSVAVVVDIVVGGGGGSSGGFIVKTEMIGLSGSDFRGVCNWEWVVSKVVRGIVGSVGYNGRGGTNTGRGFSMGLEVGGFGGYNFGGLVHTVVSMGVWVSSIPIESWVVAGCRAGNESSEDC